MVLKKLQHEVSLTYPLFEQVPWEDKAFYGWWLSQTYHYVKYTTRSLYLSAGSTSAEDDLLFDFFVSHIKEEHGHEKICLNDLKKLGQPLAEEEGEIRCVYREALHAIANKDVCYEIGFMMYFENLAAVHGPYIYSRLEKAHPKESLRFLKLHLTDDVDHVDKTNDFLEKLSPEQIKTIETAIEHSSHFYRQALNKGISRFGSSQNTNVFPLKKAG